MGARTLDLVLCPIRIQNENRNARLDLYDTLDLDGLLTLERESPARRLFARVDRWALLQAAAVCPMSCILLEGTCD
jgi:hypothetical protein